MEKIKPLMPTLREKKRYIVYEVISDKEPNPIDIINEINISAKNMLGTLEISKVGMIHLPKKYDSTKKRGILRVNNKYVDKIIASMALIKNIKDNETMIRSITVSGILKKACSKI